MGKSRGMGIRKKKGSKKVSVRRHIKQMPKLKSNDHRARGQWRIDKTLRENYKAIGISMDANGPLSEAALSRTSTSIKDQDDVNKEEQVEGLGAIQLTVPEDGGPARQRPRLSHSEVRYMKTLNDKYQDDYKRMARDIKLNFYQHTPKQLKKKMDVYHQYYAKEGEEENGEDEDEEDMEEEDQEDSSSE